MSSISVSSVNHQEGAGGGYDKRLEEVVWQDNGEDVDNAIYGRRGAKQKKEHIEREHTEDEEGGKGGGSENGPSLLPYRVSQEGKASTFRRERFCLQKREKWKRLITSLLKIED